MYNDPECLGQDCLNVYINSNIIIVFLQSYNLKKMSADFYALCKRGQYLPNLMPILDSASRKGVFRFHMTSQVAKK